MKLSEFHYDLAADRIAQEPVSPRDHSKLLVVSTTDQKLNHHHFHELDQWLRPTDVLVTNATRVFPARLKGHKKTGGKIDILLLAPLPLLLSRPLPYDSEERIVPRWGEKVGMRDGLVAGNGKNHRSPQSSPLKGEEEWRALVRGVTKATDIIFPEDLEASMEERLSEGEWVIRFSRDHIREYLDKHGEMPLPPYIKRPDISPADHERYQTVFARSEGAVAAPTAGFHFTPELLERLAKKGITRQEIVLHVGWGTFRPVRSETIEEHHMLPESYEITSETAQVLNQAKKDGHRIVAVGTTVVRTLETASDEKGIVTAGTGESRLFIYPGYHFKVIDALITNFHLPDSTPLLLANAFAARPPSPIKGEGENYPFVLRNAYEVAIQEGYRFYSYGDAMFIQ